MTFSFHSQSLLFTLFMTGCTWIGDLRLTEKEQSLDQDGDGISSFNGDCNDFDATISPNIEETWYDGIDQNCDGLDDYDQDQDGFVPTQYAGLKTDGVGGSGFLPSGDCWDEPSLPEGNTSGLTGAAIYPNAATDEFYDGVDQNCDRKSDYDADGDGYTPDEYAGLQTLGIPDGEDPLLDGGDCNDNNASINSYETEIWYNGVDQDCDGRNDFDKDNDGFVRTEDVGKETIGVENSANLAGGDCDEEDSSINPNASETYYDGIDQNCDGADDFDQDQDGFATNDPLYSGMTDSPATDCDDHDAEAHPGAIEDLTDPRDLDCDGAANSLLLTDIEWTSFDVLNTNTPAIVEQLAASANDNKLYVAFLQDLSVGLNGSANPLAIGFDFTSKTVDTFFNWATINTLYGSGIGIIVRDNMFYGGFGEYSPQNRWLHLTARNLDTGTITHRRAFINSAQPAFEDVDVYLDQDDYFHTMGCIEHDSAIGFQYAMNPSEDFFPNANNTVTAVLKLETSIPELRYKRCKFYTPNEPQSTFVGIKNNQVDLYTFTLPSDENPPTLVESSSLDIQDVQDILVFSDVEELSMIYTTSNSIAVYDQGAEQTIKASIEPSSVHAQRLEDGTILIGYVTEDGSAGLIHYNLITTTTTDFGFSTSFTPTEVQPWQMPEENELIVVAIGTQNIAYGYASYTLP